MRGRTILSPKLIRQQYDDIALHEHWCPGCEMIHQIAVEQPFKNNGARWTWDGNAAAPTFNPSINCNPKHPKHQCHYFIRAGKIQFCNDCHHELRDKTVDLPDIPADWLD